MACSEECTGVVKKLHKGYFSPVEEQVGVFFQKYPVRLLFHYINLG